MKKKRWRKPKMVFLPHTIERITRQMLEERRESMLQGPAPIKARQLLPKDLAAQAEKVAPEKVEAEVIKIISEKPVAPPTPWAGGLAVPRLQGVRPGAILNEREWRALNEAEWWRALQQEQAQAQQRNGLVSGTLW